MTVSRIGSSRIGSSRIGSSRIGSSRIGSRLLAGPRAVVTRLRRWHSRTPLRVTLVATLLALVIGALVGSGLAATATLRGYLVDRVDTQLRSVAGQVKEHGVGGGIGDPRLPSAFVIEVTDAGGATVYGPTSNLIDDDQPLPALPHVSGAESKARGERVSTVGVRRGGGQWRVLAVPVQLSDRSDGTLLVAESLADVENTVGRLEILLILIGSAAVLVLALVGYVVVRASLRPLRQVERTAARIAAGDLSQRVPDADPHTEVGQLSGALNGMLAQIEAAFAERAASEERMRRFVADASHELRTPLTSIRGFAELYRQGAATQDSDVRRLMQRIESESKRMGVLVDDLLLLARLDEQRRLDHVPVDMLTVVTDTVEAARAVAPARPITLDVGRTDPPPVVIGDDIRLRQVLDNLVGNALRHTPPGTPVAVRVGVGPAQNTASLRVVVEVVDGGPGIARNDAGRVFERFYRADPSRTRADGGTGLGLAIVASLVAGHGGTVTLDSAPGHGARFRVELPLADPDLCRAGEPGMLNEPETSDSGDVGTDHALHA